MKFIRYFALLLLGAIAVSCGSKYSYETVKGDPLKTRIYTLDNGLKVYMSVNKEEPRVQTYIAVRVGSKNDPSETTGLSHYLEHLLFKGTESFGTMNYEAEKPMLDEIERLYEVYRVTTDEAEREAIYARIDSISYEASKFGIPNEYDKLMSLIGANGTNAYTSNDMTVYVEDIPSNQMENWLRIEADRFKNMVIRGFHTELEAVYEEKNISMSSDNSKIFETILALAFPNHPYGTQTTLGTQEHLKNPSITNIKEHFAQWYVPNNMAICLAGDIDPDATMALIEKYFGDMVPNDNLPEFNYTPEAPLTSPKSGEIIGMEQECVVLGWTQSGMQNVKERDYQIIVESLLYNGMAGLLDVNINQPMKLQGAYGFTLDLKDQNLYIMLGVPNAGQTLEEARDMLLEQVALLRAGEFDETMFEAIINNYKVQYMKEMDSNSARADRFVNSFVNETAWSDEVNTLERLGKITKEEIVEYVNQTMTDNNYIVVYKRQGVDENIQRMPKPKITPIEMNRDAQSALVTEIQNSEVKPIEPVFVDFKRDMSVLSTENGMELLYKRNETTDLFNLYYVFETGTLNDPRYGFAFDYIDLLGTADMSNEEIQREFYNMASDYGFSAGSQRTYISITGLGEKMEDAIKLIENWIMNAQGDEELLATLKQTVLKGREDNKLSQRGNVGALSVYTTFGPEYVERTVLTNEQIMALTSDELLGLVKEMFNYEHRLLYFGPMNESEIVASLDNNHFVPEEVLTFGNSADFQYLLTPENKVYAANYDAPQLIYRQVSNNGITYNPKNDASIAMFNEYFGGGMNSVVFQEIREGRGLAYATSSNLATPTLAKGYYLFTNYIGTQTDKMGDVIDALGDIIENMPLSESSFGVAKEAMVSRISTERITKGDILWSYIGALDKGLDYDRRKDIYEKVQKMTLEDLVAFHKEWIAGRKYVYSVLGDLKAVDMGKLSTLGTVTVLSQEEIFGY